MDKHAYDPHTCAVCGVEHLARRDHPGLYCSKRCAQLGKNNTGWKGEEAGYLAMHGRVYRLRGKAQSCVWGCASTRYEWANLTGDYGDPCDYAAMCKMCHARYDQAMAKCFDKQCKRGHVLNNKTMYVKLSPVGQELRQCKQCARDRAQERRDAVK